jgi:hypothetical protein
MGSLTQGLIRLRALPALKRVIRIETLSQSAKALLPPHECGGSHQPETTTDLLAHPEAVEHPFLFR